jgi:hypothetical protein
MTKLDEMWDALADYQSIADDEGHGETWSDMCRLRTVEAAEASRADRRAAYTATTAAADAIYAATEAAATAAVNAVYAAAWVLCAADNAVYAAASATRNAANAKYYAQAAIDHINKATGVNK